MKVKCTDGKTRRFTKAFLDATFGFQEAYCVECGEKFGVRDTRFLMDNFRNHISCEPNFEKEELFSLDHWLKKFGFRWNGTYKKRAEGWFGKENPIWSRCEAIDEIEKMAKRKEVYREFSYEYTLREHFERLRSETS